MVVQSNQPLSLANAFREPIDNTKSVMEDSIAELIKHYERLTTAYEFSSNAIALDLTRKHQSEKIAQAKTISDLYF